MSATVASTRPSHYRRLRQRVAFCVGDFETAVRVLRKDAEYVERDLAKLPPAQFPEQHSIDQFARSTGDASRLAFRPVFAPHSPFAAYLGVLGLMEHVQKANLFFQLIQTRWIPTSPGADAPGVGRHPNRDPLLQSGRESTRVYHSHSTRSDLAKEYLRAIERARGAGRVRIVNPKVQDDLAAGRLIRLNLGVGRRPRDGLLRARLDRNARRGRGRRPERAIHRATGQLSRGDLHPSHVRARGQLPAAAEGNPPGGRFQDGRVEVVVPHFSNPYGYSDPTHVRFFGLYTFYYFADEADQPRRKVPAFYLPERFAVESVNITLMPTLLMFKPVRRLMTQGGQLVDPASGLVRTVLVPPLPGGQHARSCAGEEVEE